MSGRLNVKNLKAEGLNFSYGQRAVVEEVSLEARAGELVAIVGPNGCGKSTLLRLLLGELRAKAGRVTIDDVELGAIGRIGVARRLSLVPQQAGSGGGSAAFGYSVREMVLMSRHASHMNSEGAVGGGGMMGFETAEDMQLANESMWAADVHHLADRSVDTLSGGERQRVAIARAFTQNTPLMFLDEPTSALDLFHQLELMEQLRNMTREESRIALLVTHDLNLAAKHASRVIVMDRGRIVANGTPADVLIPLVLEPVYRVKVSFNGAGELHFERAGK